MRGVHLLIAAALALGCVREPDVRATGLGLRRVVIYRNGVAYFERAGRIDAREVSFRVKKAKVGDFLATLSVIEGGGSSVQSASFPALLEPAGKGAEDRLETVKLTLDGRRHDLVIGYVAETPVWRPSYRLVLDSHAGGAPIRSPFGAIDLPRGSAGAATFSAHLQAWGIVQNVSGEDWKGVTLLLVGEEASPSPSPSPAPPKPADLGRPLPQAERPMSPPPRNVDSLAAVAVSSGRTRYDIPFKVDVPDKSATMVMLVAQRVPGEAVFLFGPVDGAPDSRSHPFRVARFTNTTAGLLERGPIAVFEDGAFLGQGMVDPLPPGATATVPFALERSMAIESSRSESEEGARLAVIDAGEIQIERDAVIHTRYAIQNAGDLQARMLLEHPRQPGTRLFEPPRGTEDNVGTGFALVPVPVARRSTETLNVDERRVFRRRVDWLEPLADEAVTAYLADPRADAAVAGALRPAWEVRGKLRLLLDETEKLQAEKRELEGQTDHLRRNIKAIEKNAGAAPLRKELTDRLAKASSRLDEITKRMIVLEMQTSEQSIRFRDLILPIKMLEPLPLSTTSVEAGAAKKKMEPAEIQ